MTYPGHLTGSTTEIARGAETTPALWILNLLANKCDPKQKYVRNSNITYSSRTTSPGFRKRKEKGRCSKVPSPHRHSLSGLGDCIHRYEIGFGNLFCNRILTKNLNGKSRKGMGIGIPTSGAGI
ncbi:hypothetical protein NPIL_502891 [Nephila pilipes]|uniref:Uncharacterized protein n=1 Tax=Nephila pilipes TaxID=299642 RepID=A0A8X6PZ93_NEPPI|nr:hypothetical protein NPIL_502891 [Nephila pilipes]